MQPHFLYSYVRGDNIIEEINGWVEQSKNKHKEHVSSVRAVAGKRGGDTTGRPGGPGKRTKSVQSPPDIGSTASSERPGVSKCNSQNPEMQSRKAKKPRPNAWNPEYKCGTCGKNEREEFSTHMINKASEKVSQGRLCCKTCGNPMKCKCVACQTAERQKFSYTMINKAKDKSDRGVLRCKDCETQWKQSSI